MQAYVCFSEFRVLSMVTLKSIEDQKEKFQNFHAVTGDWSVNSILFSTWQIVTDKAHTTQYKSMI